MLCLPLTDATRRLVGEAELALMKPTAGPINAARGSIVDEDAVAAALASGRLAGYAADVFAAEDRQYADRSLAGRGGRARSAERPAASGNGRPASLTRLQAHGMVQKHVARAALSLAGVSQRISYPAVLHALTRRKRDE